MNKRFLFASIFVLAFVAFSFGISSAISTDMKSNYAPSETVVVKIYGNIMDPITPDRIELRRGYVDVPISYDVKKIGEDYYVWFIAPSEPNNYTLWIYNVATAVNGLGKLIDFNQSFTVSGPVKQYYVTPGVLTTSGGKIYPKIYSNADSKIQIGTSLGEGTLDLSPGSNSFAFSLQQTKTDQLIFITLGDYSLPVKVLGDPNSQIVTNESNIIPEGTVYNDLEVTPSVIKSVWLTGEKLPRFSFGIMNHDRKEISNAVLQYDDRHIIIVPETRLNFGLNETKYFNVSLYDINDSFYSQINVSYDDNIIPLYIGINFTSNPSEINTTYSSNSSNRLPLCRELFGVICDSGTVCTNQTIPSQDGACCTIGLCKEAPVQSGSYGWVGYLIGAVIIIAGVFIWLNYKKAKPSKNILENKMKESRF